MKKIFLLSIIFVTGSNLLYSQWIWQQVNPTYYYYDVQFVNKNTGYVCGSNTTIEKTTDGGLTWFNQSVNAAQDKNFNGISMLNENTGYIAGSANIVVKTINGGINWLVLKDGNYQTGNTFNDISFINLNTGWICGFGGNIQKTTDGGLTWDSIIVNNGNSTFRNIQFFDQNTGYACRDGAVYTWKSTDGGFNWFRQYLQDSAIASWANMHFINRDTGWVVGEGSINRIYRTTNGGLNWVFMSTLIGPGTFEAYSIAFINFNSGWVGGSVGKIFSTTNSGISWIDDNANSPGFVAGFSFYKDSLVWATGGHGAIGYKNIFIGIRKIGENVPVNFNLYQNYPNPFNPNTIIKFDIYTDLSKVNLIVYDVLGNEISHLVNNQLFHRGSYSVSFDGSNLPSGVYLYKLTSGDYIETKKMLMIK